MTVKKYMNLKEQLIVRIEYDECMDSPREWDNLGTFYTWCDGYYSPDKNNFSDAIEFLASILGEGVVERVHDKYTNTSDFMEDIQKRMDRAGYVLFPVSKYEHSNVRYFLGCSSGWDSGTVGVIFASKEKIYEEYGVQKLNKEVREKVTKVFEGELEEYTQWGNGWAYGYIVENLVGEELDSCWGYLGYDVYDKKEVFEMVDYPLGNKEDFEEYDWDKLNEMYEIETVTTVKAR